MPFALFLAILLCSCGGEVLPRVVDPETEPTQISVDLISIESKDGVRSFRMTTPLMKRYELAKEPSSEFPDGIHVETFNDSTALVESELTANYARLNEVTEIWEARGNVIGKAESGSRILYTEQLFWDQKTDRIYTDKWAKVIDGRGVHVGTGFESDGGFKTWTFKNPRGQMEVVQDTTEIEPDTLAAPDKDALNGTVS